MSDDPKAILPYAVPRKNWLRFALWMLAIFAGACAVVFGLMVWMVTCFSLPGMH